MSPELLMDKVRQLELYKLEEEKEKKRIEGQRKKELLVAKKQLTKEIQTASKLVKKSEQAASKVAQTLSMVEHKVEQEAARRLQQLQQMEQEAAKVMSKRAELTGMLTDRMAEVGEAKGRLAHAEMAAKMLEMGVVLNTMESLQDWGVLSETRSLLQQTHLSPERVAQLLSMGPQEMEAVLQENSRLSQEVQQLRTRLERFEMGQGQTMVRTMVAGAYRTVTPPVAASPLGGSARIVQIVGKGTPSLSEVDGSMVHLVTGEGWQHSPVASTGRQALSSGPASLLPTPRQITPLSTPFATASLPPTLAAGAAIPVKEPVASPPYLSRVVPSPAALLPGRLGYPGQPGPVGRPTASRSVSPGMIHPAVMVQAMNRPAQAFSFAQAALASAPPAFFPSVA